MTHAEHEDAGQPALEAHLPALAASRARPRDPRGADGRVAFARRRDGDADRPTCAAGRTTLYLDLATFTGVYLAHQDVEERKVMPASTVLGVERCSRSHSIIATSRPPDGASLAIMLPAMNVDDRAEMLGGMQAGAPAEVFEGIWGLAGSVLEPADHRALAVRLGL